MKWSFSGLWVFFGFFFFGHATQLWGSRFPNQGLNPGHSSETAKSSLLDHQGGPSFIPMYHLHGRKESMGRLLVAAWVVFTFRPGWSITRKTHSHPRGHYWSHHTFLPESHVAELRGKNYDYPCSCCLVTFLMLCFLWQPEQRSLKIKLTKLLKWEERSTLKAIVFVFFFSLAREPSNLGFPCSTLGPGLHSSGFY